MKEKLLENILAYLNHELNSLLNAANQAHLAAIDEQSIAETQYDTLAIEAGYLAEGQSKRAQELKAAINKLQSLPLSDTDVISTGSLVQLESDLDKRHWYFIAPAAPGYRCSIDEINYTVISPQSPLGQALMGKEKGDEVILTVGDNKINDEIIQLK